MRSGSTSTTVLCGGETISTGYGPAGGALGRRTANCTDIDRKVRLTTEGAR